MCIINRLGLSVRTDDGAQLQEVILKILLGSFQFWLVFADMRRVRYPPALHISIISADLEGPFRP